MAVYEIESDGHPDRGRPIMKQPANDEAAVKFLSAYRGVRRIYRDGETIWERREADAK